MRIGFSRRNQPAEASGAWGPGVEERGSDVTTSVPAGSSVMDASVLVVDDSETSALALDQILSSAGFARRRIVTDSRNVLDAVREEEPDLILLDLVMPHLDGFGVMRMLADSDEVDPVPPILVLTAELDQATRRRGLAAGARDFLTKPFDPGEVLLRCVNLLETRMFQRDLTDRKSELERLAAEERLARERLASSLARLSTLRPSAATAAAICAELSALGPFDRVALVGFDVGEVAMVLAAHESDNPSPLINERLAPDEDRYLRQRAANGPWIEASVTASDNDEAGIDPAGASARGEVYAPIMDGERVVGVLAAGSHEHRTDVELESSLPTVVACAAMAGAILGATLRGRP